jgi:hypothetical protein
MGAHPVLVNGRINDDSAVSNDPCCVVLYYSPSPPPRSIKNLCFCCLPVKNDHYWDQQQKNTHFLGIDIFTGGIWSL